MMNFDDIVETLKKEKIDLLFTPDAGAGRIVTMHTPNGLSYGYYEIPKSSLGPVMFRVAQNAYANEITVKVADYGLRMYRTSSTNHKEQFANVRDFIEGLVRKPSGMSLDTAVEKWKHFCDNPKFRRADKGANIAVSDNYRQHKQR